MGPAPQRSTYQSAASSIYEPQKQAEEQQIHTTNQTTKNTLEAEKGQVGTDYQSAIDKLTQSVQDQSAKIDQLYTERLGGNFSGLQGNDMGNLFARTNQAQSIIEQTRANKLASIATAEGNADINMNSQLAALAPKYQSLEADYANKAYGAAVTQYDTDAYRQQQLQLKQSEDAATNAYRQQDLALRAQTAGNSVANKYKAVGKSTYVTSPNGNQVKNTSTSNGYDFTGPNGQPINMAEYVSGKNGGQINVNDVLDLLQNGSSYDRQIYRQVQASGQTDPNKILQVIAQEDKKNYYGFGG